MSFKEGQQPRVEEKKPSDALNEVFTPLMRAFRNKIGSPGIMQKLDMYEKARQEYSEIGTRRIGILITPMEEQYKQFPTIFTHPDTHVHLQNIVTDLHLYAPVGEYGEEWAKKLVTVTDKLVHGAIATHRYLRDEEGNALSINRKNRKLLDNYTYRKSKRRKKIEPKRGSQMTSAEGFQSILFVAGFLTQYKVPGYEDNPQALLHDLAEQGLFSQLSRIIPPGITVRMGENGGVFTNPTVSKDASGKLRIRPDIVKHFYDERDGIYKVESEGSGTGADEKLDRPGCPVGRKLPGAEESGVDIAAKLFAKTVAMRSSS